MNKAEMLEIAKPILFNTEMVRAILDGRKTETRRIVKPQPLFFTGRRYIFADETCPKKWEDCDNFVETYRYQPDDILYVRETWNYGYFDSSDAYLDNSRWFEEMPIKNKGKGLLDDISGYVYKANFTDNELYEYGTEDKKGNLKPMPWHPSIHMPKEAARIFLKVTDVRVERLRDITEEQAEREGVVSTLGIAARTAFKTLWSSAIKKARDKYGWDANPWVWVVEFERIEVDG